MATEVDVLQVITSTVARGAERFAIALEPELIERGLSVRTVALTEGAPHNLEVARLGPNRLGPKTLRALRREARGAGVVVAHGSTTLPACAIATFGTKVPFVYRNIGDPYYWSTSLRRKLQSRVLLSRAEQVVALTNQTAERLDDHYSVGRGRITVIPRGVSAIEFPRRSEADRASARAGFGIDAGDRAAIVVGALSAEKNVTNAIRAVAMLPDHWTLLIAGDGPERADIEREATAVPAGRVRLLGSIDDVGALMAAADLLLLPSRTEGLPGVVIEAGMVGIPSVATRVGFIDEIVDEGVNGYLVPSNDAAAMAEAIGLAETRLDEMGDAAHDRAVAGYSLTSTADRWYDVLRPFVSGPKKAA